VATTFRKEVNQIVPRTDP